MSEDDCARQSMVTFEDDDNNKLCVPPKQCNTKGGYIFTDGNGSKCVTTSTCSNSDPKRYMYSTAGECSAQEPEENDHFSVQDGVYTCGGEYPFLDLTGEKAKCIKQQECISPNYVYVNGDTKLCLTST